MPAEFFIDGNGRDIVVNENGRFQVIASRDHRLIDTVYERIREDYPEAFAALKEYYNGTYNYRWLMVRRFLKCNLGENDHIPDYDQGMFRMEMVHCPLRGECKLDGIVCQPKYNSSLSDREMEYLDLFCTDMAVEQIADRMFVSPFTVTTQRRNIYRKLGLKSRAELINYARKHNLIQQQITS